MKRNPEKNTCTNPLKLNWYGEYKVNKPDINSGEFVDKEIADKLLAALELLQKNMDILISLTPTGDNRNKYCDDNILALDTIIQATT